MSDDLHNIDDLFKKGLEDNKETPSVSVWEAIDKSLDKKKVVSILKKYNKLKWAAAILLLFSAALAIYTLHVSKKNTELVKQNNEKNFSKNATSRVKNNPIDSGSIAINNSDLFKKRAVKTFVQTEGGNKPSARENQDTSLSHENNISGNLNQVVAKHSIPGGNLTATNNTSASNKNEIVFNSNRKYAANSKSAKAEYSVLHSTKSTANNSLTINNNRNQEQALNQQKPGISASKVTAEIDLINKDKNGQLSLNNDYENKRREKLKSSANNVDDIEPLKEKSIESGQLLPAFAYASEITFTEPALKYTTVLNSKFIVSKKSGTSNVKTHSINNAISSLSATLLFSPDWVSTSLRNEDIRFREEDRREIEKNERNNFSSTFGVLIDYKISKKLSLQSGITFSSWITNIHPRTIYARPDGRGNVNYRFNCAAGYSYLTLNSGPVPVSGDSLQALDSHNTLQYISVPLMIKYAMGTGKFNIVPGFGVSANFLTKGQIRTTIATNIGDVKASSNSIEGLKPLYFSGLADITFQYNFNRVFSFELIPTARFSLSSINKNAPVKTNLYSFGFAGAVVIRL